MSLSFEDALKKYDEQFIETHKKEIAALSRQEKKIFDQFMDDHPGKWIELEGTGYIDDLNDYFDKHYSRLVRLLVPEPLRDDLRYMLGKLNKFQYDESCCRRSFRSRDHSPFRRRALGMLDAYYLMGFRGTDLNDMGKYVSRTDCPFGVDISRRKTESADVYIIAARIDKGDAGVIGTIKEMMNSERNTEILTAAVIRAVFCSDNEELHELMCRLLVAARLSEGLRQAICENCDCGTADSFIKIIKTIQENDLIRFSSIKRAIGTWTGLGRDEDPDRLAAKILDDIPFVLESNDNAVSKLMTSDPVDIYMGLWGIGFYDVTKALDMIRSLAGVTSEKTEQNIDGRIKGLFSKPEEKSSRSFEPDEIHLLTIGYFCQNLGYPTVAIQIALSVTEQYPDSYRLFAVFENDYPFGLFVRYYHGTEPEFRKKVHNNRQLAAKHYDIMQDLYDNMPHKEEVYSPLLFPWFMASVSKSRILYAMLDCAAVMQDDEKIDFICGRLTEFDANNRCYAVEEIGNALRTPKQRETVINAVADKESNTRRTAVEILEKTGLSDSEYQVIEGFAKYKTADLRSGVITLLKKRKDKELEESIIRMLSSDNENIRLAALDLLQYGIGTYTKYDFSASKQAVKNIASPTEREQILIKNITGTDNDGQITKENGYGLYDPRAELPSVDFTPDLKVVQDFFNVTAEELNEMYIALMKIVDENKEKEYTDDSGEERILGNMDSLFKQWRSYHVSAEELEKIIPCHELWDNYYKTVIRTPQRFFALLLNTNGDPHADGLKKKAQNKLSDMLHLIFGDMSSYSRSKSLAKTDERLGGAEFSRMASDILFYLKKKFEPSVPMKVLQHIVGYTAKMIPEDTLWLSADKEKENNWYFLAEKLYCFCRTPLMQNMISEFRSRLNEDFNLNFRLSYELDKRIDVQGHIENGDIRCETVEATSTHYFIKAYRLGIIDDDIFLNSMFRMIGAKNAVSSLNEYVKPRYYYFPDEDTRKKHIYSILLAEEGRTLTDDDALPKDSELYKTGNKFAMRILDRILDVETKRGDSETVFSGIIFLIERIYGMDRLIQLLKAMGNETLSRSRWGFKNDKASCLSHLLYVCYPYDDDTSEKLKKYVRETKISQNRLIETAMFAPQWIDIIEGCVGIEGMRSGCYYFMAHTADTIDDKREAVIAKYTPLTKEELNGGCFDVKWFFEVYETLGAKNFDKLYKSAKYSSSSNRHTRARKYADAALGKMDIVETEKTISDKRNKDLLMALAIIPSKDKADILQRYEFIQKYLKESRQFGAQRRASEGEACAFALKNLAVTAGYSDETRLTLSMETALVQENRGYFEPTNISGYDVRITVDAFGKAAISVEKDGKMLRSVPAALKKNNDFLLMKEFCDKLRQQYSRTVKMFEAAMEERDLFTFGELKRLSENPVTRAITGNLVFINDEDAQISGLPIGEGLSDQNGELHSADEETKLRVAHPFDLYKNGTWSDYQKLLLSLGSSGGRKQPFRQVFRELYVKLPEELNKDRSLMFAGYQIQTKRTVGALRSRRWVADYEDGLQKIYYRDNIIASIYAQADWFSPGDIEAPVLEGVFFYDRKTGKLLSISEVPDVIYSEIMRDVDLAVSVAHAGGVDPETTHSTVEMRRVILSFNLDLFGIKNVRFEKNHALIDGKYGTYSVHLGSGVIHKLGGHQINVLAVGSGKKSRLFLPFIDEDPKTAEIMTKVLTFAEDGKIKDPYIMEQIIN